MRAIVILACLVAASNPAQAFQEIRPSSAERTIAAQCVFVGTVTEIEEKTEEAKEFPGSKETTTHTVAVVKILDPIKGVDKVTHVRIGFVLRGDLGWRDHEAHEPMNPNLIKGAKYLFYVDKHPSAGFYLAPNRTNPRLLTEEMPKTDVVDEAKTTAITIADPMKALKAEKPRDRALAAMVLLMHYRAADHILATRGSVNRVPLDAGESAAILKAIAEGDWATPIFGCVRLVQVTDYTHHPGDVWKLPVVPPGGNADLANQKAFQDWLAGPGAKYRIQKFVPKGK